MIYVVAPRDTLVLRDGRPMLSGASTAYTLSMPWPAAIAGLARTRVGLDSAGRFVGNPATLRAQVKVRGPWLARLGSEGRVEELYFPAPADAVWFGAGEAKRRHRLRPLGALGQGQAADVDLELVGLSDPPSEKPVAGPAYYAWSAMKAWLESPEDRGDVPDSQLLDRLDRERRTQVSINEHGTAKDGQLFSVDGLRFERRTPTGGLERYAVAFASDADALAKRPGLVVLGGERRPATLRADGYALPTAPRLEGRRLRVVLTTPASFSEGSVPKQLCDARVVAACVGRPEVISGWDFEKNRPKPARRVCPAGSVFWVEPEGDVQAYVDRVWLQSVCTDEQDQRDGYGIALVGVA